MDRLESTAWNVCRPPFIDLPNGSNPLKKPFTLGGCCGYSLEQYNSRSIQVMESEQFDLILRRINGKKIIALDAKLRFKKKCFQEVKCPSSVVIIPF